MYAPSARAMKRGVPPTVRNARTGEFTPPGITRCARSNRPWLSIGLSRRRAAPRRLSAPSGGRSEATWGWSSQPAPGRPKAAERPLGGQERSDVGVVISMDVASARRVAFFRRAAALGARLAFLARRQGPEEAVGDHVAHAGAE